jgi:DNA-binding NtrC family response regulator
VVVATRILQKKGGGLPGLAVRRLRLKAIAGPGKGATVERAMERAVIGSAAECDLALADPSVSRFHAEIVLDDAGLRLRDLGSTNGTRVDGVRIADAWVEAGARIAVGETTVRLEVLREEDEVEVSGEARFGDLVGESAVMRRAFALLARAARTDATVLVVGETGTGKELAARAIHEASSRAKGPFVVVDCGAVARSLVESELFGHERGSFTGAVAMREGAFETADGGTLFLDEIGELDLDLQPRLLRVLDRREVKRIGATGHRKVDVRVLAATNRDLAREVNRGAFREDLYFRLAVIRVELPPLRARKEDIALLARQIAREVAGEGTVLSDDVIATLESMPWPGNVRELRGFIERALLLRGLDDDGDGEAPAPSWTPEATPTGDTDARIPFKVAKQAVIDRFERAYLENLLALEGGNLTASARRAGLDRVHLLRLLDKFSMRKRT